MGSMYTAVIFLGLQNAASVQPVVNVERTVFYREQAAGMYSAMPYAFAQVTKKKSEKGEKFHESFSPRNPKTSSFDFSGFHRDAIRSRASGGVQSHSVRDDRV